MAPPNATTTSCSASRATPTRQTIKKAFRRLARQLHPDVSTEPDAERAVPRGDRGVRGALERRDPRALRPLRPRRAALGRVHADALRRRRPQRPVRGVLRRRPLRRRCAAAAAQRGADVAARDRDRARRRRARHDGRASRSRWPSTCARCGGDGVEPGTTPDDCARCAGTGRLQQVSRSVFGEFVRTAPCPTLPAAAASIVEHPCTGVRRRRAGRSRSASSRSTSLPASTTGSASGSPARGTRARSAGARATCTSSSASKPDARFVREGNDIYSQVDLTIVAGGARRDASRSRRSRAGRARAAARRAAGRGARAAREGHARAAGLRPRRPTRARQRLGAAPPERRAAAPARGVRAASDEHTYSHDEGFFEKLKSAFR